VTGAEIDEPRAVITLGQTMQTIVVIDDDESLRDTMVLEQEDSAVCTDGRQDTAPSSIGQT
jgi:hypothetical protein